MKFFREWYLVTGVIGIALVGAYIFLKHEKPFFAPDLESPVPARAEIKEAHSINGSSSGVASIEPSVKKNEALSQVAKFEYITRWMQERGAQLESVPEYKGYSDETLEKLADGGDIRALAILADKYGSKYDEVSQRKASAARTKAAIYGSTYALEQEAVHYEKLAYLANDENKKKAYIMESMAMRKVSVLRGYPINYLADLRSPEYMSLKIDLNQNDFIAINSAAQNIYNILLEKRQSLGLGDFDNSVPEIVQRHFDDLDPRKEGVKGY